MSLHGDVHAGLKQRLATLANPPALATENRVFESTIDEPYLRERFVPQDSDLRGLGPRGRVRHSGAWFLDVFVPAGLGTTDGDTLAGAVLDLFPPAFTLNYNGHVVTIDKAYRSGGRSEPSWYMIPITVLWFTDTLNTI